MTLSLSSRFNNTLPKTEADRTEADRTEADNFLDDPTSKEQFLNCPDFWRNVAGFCPGYEQNAVRLIKRSAEIGVGHYRKDTLLEKFTEDKFSEHASKNIGEISNIFFSKIIKPSSDPSILAMRINNILHKKNPEYTRNAIMLPPLQSQLTVNAENPDSFMLLLENDDLEIDSKDLKDGAEILADLKDQGYKLPLNTSLLRTSSDNVLILRVDSNRILGPDNNRTSMRSIYAYMRISNFALSSCFLIACNPHIDMEKKVGATALLIFNSVIFGFFAPQLSNNLLDSILFPASYVPEIVAPLGLSFLKNLYYDTLDAHRYPKLHK